MSNTMMTTEALFEGGPTLDEVSGEGSWSVREEARETYLQLASQVTWRDLASANETTAHTGMLTYSLRNSARLACGLPEAPSETSVELGWPSDVPKGRLAAYSIHVELAARAVDAYLSSVSSAQVSAAVAAGQACQACGEGARVHDVGALAGLCVTCMAAARHLQAQRDAEAASQKVGGKFTGKTRGQLVAAFMDSQPI